VITGFRKSSSEQFNSSDSSLNVIEAMTSRKNEMEGRYDSHEMHSTRNYHMGKNYSMKQIELVAWHYVIRPLRAILRAQ
jgi:hypothetical protein